MTPKEFIAVLEGINFLLLKSSNKIMKLQFFLSPFGLTSALWRAGIPRRIGTSHRWYSFLLTDRVHQSRKECLKHEAEYNLDLLEPLIQDLPN